MLTIFGRLKASCSIGKTYQFSFRQSFSGCYQCLFRHPKSVANMKGRARKRHFPMKLVALVDKKGIKSDFACSKGFVGRQSPKLVHVVNIRHKQTLFYANFVNSSRSRIVSSISIRLKYNRLALL